MPDKKSKRILILSGSNRRQYNCPGVDSKSRSLALRAQSLLEKGSGVLSKSEPAQWEIDFEDLGNIYGRARIQSCNACVSTSMALCVWPCNCYEKNNSKEPDLMWNLNMYERLDLADAWMIIGPVNWYGPTSNLKLMFDRLVCMNGGNPREELIDHKNPELAMKLEHDPLWETLSVNHLEGRTAGFFCYGDGGGDELDSEGRPEVLKHKQYFDPKQEPFKNMRDAYAPLVWQCRYGGIEVPDPLWTYHEFGRNKKYSDNQAEDMASAPDLYETFDQWVQNFAQFVNSKEAPAPGKFRAAGYQAPGHQVADLKLWLRDAQIFAGLPPSGSSPEEQQRLGLNKDTVWDLGKGRPPKST